MNLFPYWSNVIGVTSSGHTLATPTAIVSDFSGCFLTSCLPGQPAVLSRRTVLACRAWSLYQFTSAPVAPMFVETPPSFTDVLLTPSRVLPAPAVSRSQNRLSRGAALLQVASVTAADRSAGGAHSHNVAASGMRVQCAQRISAGT